MSNQIVPMPQRAAQAPAVTFGEMQQLANSIAKSGLFGMKTPEQALALMAIAQAEGRHPALAARDYDIIQGRAAKKSEAMLRDCIEGGGKIEWHDLSDSAADATFSHPAGGTVRIKWDMERAKAAGLLGKDNYKKYPRQMLRSRCVSEGVRTVCPAATSGMYVPEEVADFEPRATVIPPTTPVHQERLAPPPAPNGNGNGNGNGIGRATLSESDERALDRASMRDMRHKTPEHDPTTGEIIENNAPATPSSADQTWKAWCDGFIARVAAADTSAHLSSVLQSQDRELDACETAAPDLARMALQAYRNRAATLAQSR